jgi:hypothetical protein
MKKFLFVMLTIVLAIGLTAPAFAVHPSEPAEQVPLIGKAKIELGGSIRLRGDYRKDLIGSNLGAIAGNTFTGLFAWADLTDWEDSAYDDFRAVLTNGIGDLNADDVIDINDAVLAFIDEGYSVSDAIALADDLDNLDLLSTILDGAFPHSENNAYWDGRVRVHLNAYVTDNTMGRVQIESGSTDATDTYKWGCDGAHDSSGVYSGGGNCKKGELRILEAWIQHDFTSVPLGFKVGHMPIILGRGLFVNHTKFGDDALDVYMKPADNITIDLVDIKHSEGSTTSADDETDSYSAIVNFTSDMINVGGDFTWLRDKNFLGFDEGADLYNLGVRGDVDLNMAKIYADVEFQFGDAKDDASDIKLDFGGWAVVAGADAKLGEVGLNAEFGMGSGLDEDKFVEDFVTDGDANFDMFVTSLSDTKKFTYVYDYRMMTAALDTNTGIANTTYVKLGANSNVTPDMKAGADVYWLRATQDVLQENNLGWEVDGNLAYNIDKNLQYFVEGGILFTGDFYDKFDEDGDADNAYVVRHGIQLAF